MTFTQTAKVTIWQVLADASIIGTFKTQSEALTKAAEIVSSTGSAVIVHGITNDTIQVGR